MTEEILRNLEEIKDKSRGNSILKFLKNLQWRMNKLPICFTVKMFVKFLSKINILILSEISLKL